jgi:Uncharacterised nucleotidyltransferase
MPLGASDIARMTNVVEPFLPTLKRKNLDSLFYIGCGVTSVDQHLYDQVWSAQRATLLSIGRRLADDGVKFYSFKGSESSERWYRSRGLGFFNDIDILVDRADIGYVKSILYQNGFRQAYLDRSRACLVDRDVAEIASIEGHHYELAPFVKLLPVDLAAGALDQGSDLAGTPLVVVNDRAMVGVEVDIHHGIATDIDVGDLTDDARASATGLGLSFSDSNQVWVLTSRYYTEVALHGKGSLRDFTYILPILAAGEIDWDVILRAARKYELRSSLFYYLSFMSFLAGNPLPEEVGYELSPLRGPRLRDWGWQLGKLFESIEVFPFDDSALRPRPL